MSRDDLRALVESLRDELVPEAISALKHLEDDEPLSEQERKNIEASLEDIRMGRIISLEEYQRKHGM